MPSPPLSKQGGEVQGDREWFIEALGGPFAQAVDKGKLLAHVGHHGDLLCVRINDPVPRCSAQGV